MVLNPTEIHPELPASSKPKTPAPTLSAADAAAVLADFLPASKAGDHTKRPPMKRLAELSEEIV